MKYNFIKRIGIILISLWGTFLCAQSALDGEQSAALKTIRSIDDIPVVYQDEAKGGYHQYPDEPWDTIPEERITQGMIAFDSSTGASYRYIGTAFIDGIANSNKEADWERIYFIIQHDASAYYLTGEIVVSDYLLYQANADIDGTTTSVPITDSRWTPLSTDDQQLNLLSISTDDTLSVGLENGDTLKVDLSQLKEEFRVNDETGASSVVTTYNSGGTEIVLVNGDYTLPVAASKCGATVTVKNVLAATSSATSQIDVTPATSELIDGVTNDTIALYRQYDYITLVSDSTQWFLVAEGSSKVVERNASSSYEHDDAFYWGDPDTNGSWRMIYSDDSRLLFIQRRQGGTWRNKAAVVP